jgi:biopolymer transport protein ExbD
MLLKKKKRDPAEIPSSSLADIAFLLLIFFLVTTTIDVDTGIGLVLPPPPDDSEPPPIKERNMMKLLVNSQGLILMNEKPSALTEVKETLKRFIDNKGADANLSVSPQNAIISLKTDKQTPYRIYIDVLDEVKGAYADLRNTLAMSRYGVPYDKLSKESQKVVNQEYPQKISEAEPDKGN